MKSENARTACRRCHLVTTITTTRTRRRNALYDRAAVRHSIGRRIHAVQINHAALVAAPLAGLCVGHTRTQPSAPHERRSEPPP